MYPLLEVFDVLAFNFIAPFGFMTMRGQPHHKMKKYVLEREMYGTFHGTCTSTSTSSYLYRYISVAHVLPPHISLVEGLFTY